MSVATENTKAVFSVAEDNPFIIFGTLQKIARASRGADVIDLSRGDPGYGFIPSVRGRAFASLVLQLDCIVNAKNSDLFLQYTKNDLPELEERISMILDDLYTKETAERYRSLLRSFVDGAIAAAAREGKSWNAFEVYQGLFSYCAMSGGSYLEPIGQELTRVVVADWHRKEYDVPITSDRIILTNGLSHGMGTVFKALGEEGSGYLQKGDSAVIASPVYYPYNSILDERGVRPLTFSINPEDGTLSDLPEITANDRAKILVLIDPNNPTGFSLSEDSLQQLAEFARAHNLIIITDEVYYSFFPKKKTMLHFAPERTLCLNTRSKMERATGLRFGEIMVLPEGQEQIAKMLGLQDADALMQLFVFAKAPHLTGGQLQHTTFVPGPSQLLGIAHLILGTEEREQYKRDLQENGKVFCKALGLPHSGNLYYVVFDLDALEGCTTQDLSIEEKLIKLAENGIVYIPAYRFFSEKDRARPEIMTTVRASVVNTTPDKLGEAARRTKEVLC